MKKDEFMKLLKKNITSMKKKDREEILEYYEEIILDKMESGLTEQDAVKDLGNPEAVAQKILKENATKDKCSEELFEKTIPASSTFVKVILFLIACPILLPLAFAIVILLLSFWIIIVCFYFTAIMLGIAGIIHFPFSIFLLFTSPPHGILQLGICLSFVGFGIFLFLGTEYLMRLAVRITKSFGQFVPKFFKGVFQ